MNILVRMPNWMGDVVMSTGFFTKLQEIVPGARLHAVVRRELSGLAAIFPQIHYVHPFERDREDSLPAARRFASAIASETGGFDYFFCLPPSFSSAFMGFFTSSSQRIGYKGQWRSWMFTCVFHRPEGLHRVEEFAYLLGILAPDATKRLRVSLAPSESDACMDTAAAARPLIGFNINADAPSRRLSAAKAAVIADALHETFGGTIIFTGAASQRSHTAECIRAMRCAGGYIDMSGKTSPPQLAWLMARLDALVSADSGPAHLANATGTPVAALFGAGDESKTAPWNRDRLRIIRAAPGGCEKCGENACRHGTVQCMENIGSESIVEAVREILRMKKARIGNE